MGNCHKTSSWQFTQIVVRIDENDKNVVFFAHRSRENVYKFVSCRKRYTKNTTSLEMEAEVRHSVFLCYFNFLPVLN